MNARNGTAAILSALLLSASSGAALAQSSGWAEIPDSTLVEAFGMKADVVEDLDIVDDAGNKIGEVEDVLTKGGERAEALGIEFEGFSDYSPKDDVDVIVPIDHFAKKDDKSLTLRDKPEAIRTMETYDD
jgi:hypothetical protein